MRRGGRPRHPKEGGEDLAYRAGITDEAAVCQVVRAAADAFGAVDVLVNILVKNALPDLKFYTVARRDLAHLGWDYYLQQLGAARGALYCAKAVVAGMVEKGGGRIVSVVSNLINNPVVAYHDYTSAKSAFLGFSRKLTAALGPPRPNGEHGRRWSRGRDRRQRRNYQRGAQHRRELCALGRLGPPKTLGAPS